MTVKRLHILAYLLLIGVVFFPGCAGTKRVEQNSVLSSQIVFNQSKSISANVPLHWFAPEANDSSGIDLWLVKDDYSASIVIISINVNTFQTKSGIQSELDLVAKLFLAAKKAEGGKNFKLIRDLTNFRLANKLCIEFEFLDKNLLSSRSIVFMYKGGFYSCTLKILKPNSSIYSDKAVQNAVLNSIE
ncbi:MAG: hypothetical protein ABIG69_04810 [Bacteroidota bacterium]|nr:hypothetical protein [Bacteroidota bacterium]